MVTARVPNESGSVTGATTRKRTHHLWQLGLVRASGVWRSMRFTPAACSCADTADAAGASTPVAAASEDAMLAVGAGEDRS